LAGFIAVQRSWMEKLSLFAELFSSDPAKSKETGKALYLPENRVYNDFRGNDLAKEKQLPEGERMDFVAIVTPNHVHHAPTKLALENGFHVVCDKPITLNTEEAEEIVAAG
jgi:predicted dehydrogenase